MANSVTFVRYNGNPVIFKGDTAVLSDGLSASTVKSFTVAGDPWVFFDHNNYGGKFLIYGEGTYNFPASFAAIQSLRVIPGGILSSEVQLFDQAFFKGNMVPYTNDATQLTTNYFSLRVIKGAVVFYNGPNYTEPKSILLKGDEVQNFSALRIPGIGNSVKPARVTQ